MSVDVDCDKDSMKIAENYGADISVDCREDISVDCREDMSVHI